MANDFYQHSGWPGTRAMNASASWRSEFGLIEAGFDKMPDVSTANLFPVTDGSALVGKTAAQAKVILSLNNCDNTSDLGKPISTQTQDALALKAALDSPVFTGSPTAPTQGYTDDSNKIATTAFVATGIRRATPGVMASAGYKVLPSSDGNLALIQWGRVSTNASAGTATTHSFPVAFSVEPYVVIPFPISGSSPSTTLIRIYNYTTTGFTSQAGAASVTVAYIAIGSLQV